MGISLTFQSMFNLLAVPPRNGVIAWVEIDHLLQKYYENSALIFYFILFNISIKCAQKRRVVHKHTQVYVGMHTVLALAVHWGTAKGSKFEPLGGAALKYTRTDW